VEAPPHPDLLPLKGGKERGQRAKFAILVAALLLICPSAFAQPAAYPSRVIHIVVPSPAGGPPDQIARLVATRLATAFNQSVIVENRPGAGGMVGTAHVAKTAPDGYTVLITTASHALIPAFTPNTPYDAVKDFSPVTMLAENFGQALLVRPSLPVKTVQELVALARAQPGKLSYGQAGLGTASHIPAEVMLAAANIDMLEVPYKGTSEAMTDLLSGRIDMFFIGPQVGLPFVQDGKLRALALTGRERWKGMPDVPTMQEQGFPDFNVVNWFGAWLPARAPPAIVARLQREIARALQESDMAKTFDVLGLRAVGSSPDEFARFVAQEAAAAQDIARRMQGRKK
jgi:tripartite-type tricarboxylate transporter receptor subunit TctC